MPGFMIRFLICNLFISIIIGILLTVKRILKNSLTGRMQYNLWFLLLGLLVVPFIPLRPVVGFPQLLSWLWQLKTISAVNTESTAKTSVNLSTSGTTYQVNDFALSVSQKAPSVIGWILFCIWITGILIMIVFMIRSKSRLNVLKKSALPLQNCKVHRLYKHCLEEMKITADIPIYSTAFLKSPVIVGLFRPCIYLPIHLISDCCADNMRFILLHELQHYRHRDALANYLMNLAGTLYWFNPFVQHALKEMRNDREIACDTSVLKMLNEDAYEAYGITLINLAEKLSLNLFPFAAGISGNRKQLERRIRNIASYKSPTFVKRLKGVISFVLTAAILAGLAPVISTYAADGDKYQWEFSSENISFMNLSDNFGEYEGSFVFYDLKKDFWSIYNMEHAALRVSPNSTYKIYDALFGLEDGIITPEDSFMAWNNELYPFDAWNADQTLQSAMSSSVNWYFQAIDEQLGKSALNSYIREIEYGNKNISEDLSAYWLESSLKISPIEQVELLTKLYSNSFHFTPENVDAVKDSIRLPSSTTGTLYGKTGTGRIEGQDVNGWFIGYVETADNTYFFATNIKADANASGSNAAEITLSILSDMNIYFSLGNTTSSQKPGIR